jgi:transposase
MFPAPLPDLDGLDPEELKALLIAKHNESIEQHKQLRSTSQEIEHLKLVIEKYRRMIFGRKSEKLTRELEQLELRLEELETTQAADQAAEQTSEAEQQGPPKSDSKPRGSRSRRKPLPEDLPREVIMHMPEHDSCPCCGGELHQFGEDVSEQLERIPATFKVIRHVRPKFACSACDRVVEAPAPSRPIAYGLAGPDLLAHVLVSKFADHQPLYRQSEIFAREGIDLDRSTLAGWVDAASELVAPLVDEISKHVLLAWIIHFPPQNGQTFLNGGDASPLLTIIGVCAFYFVVIVTTGIAAWTTWKEKASSRIWGIAASIVSLFWYMDPSYWYQIHRKGVCVHWAIFLAGLIVFIAPPPKAYTSSDQSVRNVPMHSESYSLWPIC